ncbi:dipeptidyl-peptidase-3 [Williamwhitmania taraxaci]|uniref:Dipeptidyl-peptidase-3 n=2 Tax=Williamwhitmania taraxaci TaxID=1640674 RepID=A0A1G6TCK6_9BACT|nr:dipeptidyl-peptidase-3 [Williamwhitmania taraxaci]
MYMVALGALAAYGCSSQEKGDSDFQWQVDKFADIKILRYQVPDFDSLSLGQKKLVFFLSQAALSGRDILWDQNYKYNLAVRRTLEAIYTGYDGDRTTPNFEKFVTYLKRVWFSNGIHHHYSNEKFIPEFSKEYFAELVANTPERSFPKELGTLIEMQSLLVPIIFDPEVARFRVNQTQGVDLVASSAMNYYEGVTQKEAEDFYAKMVNPKDTQPISYGLNSKLVKENGLVFEKVWKVGGMYSAAIEKIVYWLQKAEAVAENDIQKQTIRHLIDYLSSFTRLFMTTCLINIFQR